MMLCTRHDEQKGKSDMDLSIGWETKMTDGHLKNPCLTN